MNRPFCKDMPDLPQLRWIFCGIYLLVALLALRVSMKQRGDEHRLWSVMAATLIVLGIAKGIDAEELLLDLVRSASQRQHVYGWHKIFQAVWLFLVLAVAAGWTMTVLLRLRSVGRTTIIALCSFALLISWIAIRLASIHVVDLWVTVPILRLRAGWWFELVSLAVIAAAASAPSVRTPRLFVGVDGQA